MYYSTDIKIDRDTTTTPGRATRHSNGTITGHVAIYLPSGSASIASEDPDVLDQLAGALSNAATELRRARQPDVDEQVARNLAIATGGAA